MDGIVLLVLLAIMWAVLLLPQQRRSRRHKELIATITVGDDVVTSSGIYGTITGEDDGDLFLEISTDVEIRIARGAVASKVEFEDHHDHNDDSDDSASGIDEG